MPIEKADVGGIVISAVMVSFAVIVAVGFKTRSLEPMRSV